MDGVQNSIEQIVFPIDYSYNRGRETLTLHYCVWPLKTNHRKIVQKRARSIVHLGCGSHLTIPIQIKAITTGLL
jgi:hypothetical protein